MVQRLWVEGLRIFGLEFMVLGFGFTIQGSLFLLCVRSAEAEAKAVS